MQLFQNDVLPTDKEVNFYRENGWLLTDLILSDEAIEVCKNALEEVYRGEYDQTHNWSKHPENRNFKIPYTDRSVPRIDSYLSLHKTVLKTILHAPQFAAYAAKLMKTHQVRLYRDIVISMPEQHNHKSGTALHIDKNYWPTCSSSKMVSTWFPLSDCDQENGCLLFIKGSHRWKRNHFIHKVEPDRLDHIARMFDVAEETVEVIPVPHRRGQISFHSCLLLHATFPNRTKNLRQSCITVFQDAENTYSTNGLSKRDLLLNCNTNDRVGPKTEQGLPDYHHPEFYPVLFAGREFL